MLPPGLDKVMPKLPGLPLKDLPGALNPLALADKMAGRVLKGMEGVSGAFAGLSSGVVSSADMRFAVPPEAVEVSVGGDGGGETVGNRLSVRGIRISRWKSGGSRDAREAVGC